MQPAQEHQLLLILIFLYNLFIIMDKKYNLT